MSDRFRVVWARWVWLCPLLALALAAGILVLWGFTLWTAIGVALLLACPAILIWAMLYFGRDEVKDKLLEDYRRKHNS
jgi:predicted benzoate:H+ symporter BenE